MMRSICQGCWKEEYNTCVLILFPTRLPGTSSLTRRHWPESDDTDSISVVCLSLINIVHGSNIIANSIALRQVLSSRVCWYEYWYMHNTVGSHHMGDEYSPLPPPWRTHCFRILFSSIFHSQHKSSEIHGKERYLHNFYVSWALHGEGNTIGNSGYWALDKTEISLKAQQRSWQGDLKGTTCFWRLTAIWPIEKVHTRRSPQSSHMHIVLTMYLYNFKEKTP